MIYSILAVSFLEGGGFVFLWWKVMVAGLECGLVVM